MLSFICWYCAFIYDKSIIFVMFYFKPLQKISQILNLFLCDIFETQFFAADK